MHAPFPCAVCGAAISHGYEAVNICDGTGSPELCRSLLLAGFAQLPLTATNAVIATSALISHDRPQRPVSENRLALNQGVMNLVLPFFGGMPMCHGAGKLAGQYYFGARTGGTNLIEGLIEISLALGAVPGPVHRLAVRRLPLPIMGAMMLLVGLELVHYLPGAFTRREGSLRVKRAWGGETLLSYLRSDMSLYSDKRFFLYCADSYFCCQPDEK